MRPQNFAALKEMLSKASPSLMDAGIVNSTSRFCSLAKADEVEVRKFIILCGLISVVCGYSK